MKTIPLAEGVTLRCFPHSLFKQNILTIQFLRPMCREEASLNALLPAVLLRGCETAPDMRSITLKLDDLYGAGVGALVRRIGDYQSIGLSCTFVEEDFALEGDCILAPMLQFLGQLLYEPVLQDGAFIPQYVESEKTNLISAIEANRNNKRAYAISQLLQGMCREDSFGISQYGEAEQVAAISPEQLYRHYQRVLSQSPLELFYVGSAQPEAVAQLLKAVFCRDNRKSSSLPAQTPYRHSEPVHLREKMQVTQGKLCMGYTTPITSRDSRFVAMQVLNMMLGGGMTCKLFMHIRETLSLCYDISSSYRGSKGILIITAGIDFQAEDRVRREIEHQLQLCRDGSFTQEELVSAKEQLISQLQGIHDSPGTIEGYYASGILSGMALSPQDYMDAVSQVTGADVCAAAQTLTLHSTYFLTGEDIP